MKISKNSLQAKIKKLSSQKGVPSNVILQDYFFDAFLRRMNSPLIYRSPTQFLY